AVKLQAEGADIIDIVGESTRPGAEAVPLNKELDRVLPVIEQLASLLSIPISIDTYKSAVADAALAAGAEIVNDISGCRYDHKMGETVARYGAGLVLMHMKGEPKTMQDNPYYEDVLLDIIDELDKSVQIALAAGVRRDQIVIDPGIGFGKRLQDNLQILNELQILEQLELPIMVGPSRKSFIGKLLDLPSEERLEGTIASITAAILRGAHIIRVHDVKAVKRAAIIADAIAGHIETVQ
ncbi:MAG: dihydropteroate synthase, partial [Calditrichaeota bacterium]